MQLGYVMTEARGATDRLLADFASRALARGVRLSGVVQTNTECLPDSALCDMDVQVLPEGQKIRISQSLGAGARGCRLDPSALEQAVALVGKSLTDGAPQLLIVNKFGKHESDGRGFRPVIGQALLAGLPVLAGVNGANHEAFVAFAEGMAERVPADLDAIEAWCARVLTAQDA